MTHRACGACGGGFDGRAWLLECERCHGNAETKDCHQCGAPFRSRGQFCSRDCWELHGLSLTEAPHRSRIDTARQARTLADLIDRDLEIGVRDVVTVKYTDADGVDLDFGPWRA